MKDEFKSMGNYDMDDTQIYFVTNEDPENRPQQPQAPRPVQNRANSNTQQFDPNALPNYIRQPQNPTQPRQVSQQTATIPPQGYNGQQAVRQPNYNRPVNPNTQNYRGAQRNPNTQQNYRTQAPNPNQQNYRTRQPNYNTQQNYRGQASQNQYYQTPPQAYPNNQAQGYDQRPFTQQNPKYPIQVKSPVVAALLCWFFGVLGIHRFYTGWIPSGIAMLLLSIFLIGLPVTSVWMVFDLVRILMREFPVNDGSGTFV